MSNWAYNLDMLAQNGVLDYDAPSYITGQAPRYVGNPSVIPPFNGPVPNAPNMQQPQVDEFKPANDKNNFVKNPSWKKWLFGILAAGTLIFGGWKFKSKILPYLKNLPKTLKFDKIGDFFKNGWEKFTGLFKRKKS